MSLENYVLGNWVKGDGEGKPLYDASTGELVTTASAKGLDFNDILEYGRNIGNPALRKMTFRERGVMIKKLALHLYSIKDKYYPISFKTGATKADSWVDIEGGIGNLFANASLRRQLGDQPYYIEGDIAPLSKNGTFIGHHMLVPKTGIALHINAFNFPIWGMLEKCAVNWIAGVPAVVKPATLTSYLTEAMVRDIIESGILPEGALQLITGSAHGIIDHVKMGDTVTFTGSASTGKALKSNPVLVDESVPFNLEADSLNCAVLGSDVTKDMPEFELFVKEVRKEMTVKCGQKCTAIRRIIVPEHLMEDVQIALANQLSKTKIGDPRHEGVRMGALAGREQVIEVKGRIAELASEAQIVYGDPDAAIDGLDMEKGAFMAPVLLRNDDPFSNMGVHEIEAFGPVSTLMPYKSIDEAVELAKLGKGSLVSSMTTYDDQLARNYVVQAATHHGRILILNRDCAKESTGHGSPMPLLVHGGPGRAGGGEEMGGMRGVMHYLQRCAIQGSPTTMTEVAQKYMYGGNYKDPGKHVFRKYFEDLEVGETVITHKRTITEADIINFANVSWDHFYAHTDTTSLEGTTFDERVAHGYFILSAAAGLFVDPGKGPVLLNYGLDDCRFVKPVYAGATIGVRFTVKEKLAQEKKDDEEFRKGIVKFLVDVYDETGETVALATILTMIKMREQ